MLTFVRPGRCACIEGFLTKTEKPPATIDAGGVSKNRELKF
jgi:hypothetical protein